MDNPWNRGGSRIDTGLPLPWPTHCHDELTNYRVGFQDFQLVMTTSQLWYDEELTPWVTPTPQTTFFLSFFLSMFNNSLFLFLLFNFSWGLLTWPNEDDWINLTESWQQRALIIKLDQNWNRQTFWNWQTLNLHPGSS